MYPRYTGIAPTRVYSVKGRKNFRSSTHWLQANTKIVPRLSMTVSLQINFFVYLHLQGRSEFSLFYPEDGGSIFLRNVSSYPTTWRHTLLSPSFILNMEVTRSSETSITMYRATRHDHIQEDSNIDLFILDGDNVKWRDFVNTVLNFWVLLKARFFDRLSDSWLRRQNSAPWTQCFTSRDCLYTYQYSCRLSYEAAQYNGLRKQTRRRMNCCGQDK
jgi:hypothetical protein